LRLRLRLCWLVRDWVWWQLRSLLPRVAGWLSCAVQLSVWLRLSCGRGCGGASGWGAVDRCCSVWGSGRAGVVCDRGPVPGAAGMGGVRSIAWCPVCMLVHCIGCRLEGTGCFLRRCCSSGGAACSAGGSQDVLSCGKGMHTWLLLGFGALAVRVGLTRRFSDDLWAYLGAP
jgi:hypothetical protein